MDILKLFIEGGFIMWPLLACSVVIWIVFIEKTLFLWHFRSKFRSFHTLAYEYIKAGKITELNELIDQSDKLIAVPYKAALNQNKLSQDKLELRVSRKLKETQSGLKKYLWMLGTVASASPFIGLFGTVIGIIKSFDSIAEAGKGGFAIVAAGLSEALIATAAGIIVAVIAVVFFNYFQTKLSILNEEYKHKLEDFYELIG